MSVTVAWSNTPLGKLGVMQCVFESFTVIGPLAETLAAAAVLGGTVLG
jgi:hypothetical protein